MIVLAAHEILESVRSRWFVALTGVFCALALGVSFVSFGGAGGLQFAGFDRTVASLLHLLILFVPLMALLVGALGLSGEREDGTLGYLLAQPVGRGSVYLGKIAGQALSLAGAICLGLGLCGLVIGSRAGAEGVGSFGWLALAALLLSCAGLGVGVLVAVLAASRLQALALALLAWVVFAFGIDFVAVGLVSSGRIGAAGLFWLSCANPVQAAKVLCLLALSAKLEILGPAGIYAVKTLGAPGAGLCLGGALAAWAVLPATAGWFLFRRMNLR